MQCPNPDDGSETGSQRNFVAALFSPMPNAANPNAHMSKRMGMGIPNNQSNPARAISASYVSVWWQRANSNRVPPTGALLVESRQHRTVNSERGGWWLLLIVALAMAAGATVHLSQRDPPFQSQAIGPTPAVAPSPSSTTPGPRWQHPPGPGRSGPLVAYAGLASAGRLIGAGCPCRLSRH
jgi:hypothetical protein